MDDNYICQQREMIEQIKNKLKTGQAQSTFVEMQADYDNDVQICLTSLVFVPENLAQLISNRIIKSLENIEANHFYYSAELMHVTIKNIRTINTPPLFTDADAVKVNQLFTEIIPQFSSFTFTFEDVILFPTSVAVIGYCNETLKHLIQALDSGLKEIGVPDNKTYFSDTLFFGNLTVCRLTHEPSLAFRHQVKELENIQIGEMPVTHIHLITCNSVCSPKTRKIVGTYQLLPSR